ncbi:MAG: SPFH domain-containing protein [Candidatus Saccharimonadales bacterium]
MEFLSAVLPYLPIVGAVIVIAVLLLVMIKVVSGNEVLVVTGIGATKKVTKKVKMMRDGVEVEEEQVTYEPKVKIAGASLVIPFIQRAQKFDICVEKAEQKGDTMKTRDGVEVDIDWVISYAPNADTIETLQPAIRQFLDKQKPEIEDIIKNAVAGGVRAVISTMTPVDVMVGKDKLDEAVQKNISGQMAELGYKVQLYIQEVRDPKEATYYKDLAAEERESMRRKAANITAEANQAIRQKTAESEQQAQESELASKVAIAAKTRDTAVQEAGFKAETDKAQADAEVAGQLQMTERQKELATKEGEVAVVRNEQANRAAETEQTVKVTQAETVKKEQVIGAQADAERRKIEADAQAAVDEKAAEGRANAAKKDAAGQAEAVKLQAAADADKVRLAGEAEASAISARGKAEADAIRAKGLAEAEAESAKADALAKHDGVNLQVELAEIYRSMQVEVATNVGKVMASVGEKTTIYDFGGSSRGDGTGSTLTSFLGDLPRVLKQAGLSNEALNGETFNDTISKFVGSVVGPLGVLNKETRVIGEGSIKGGLEDGVTEDTDTADTGTSEEPVTNGSEVQPDGEEK